MDWDRGYKGDRTEGDGRNIQRGTLRQLPHSKKGEATPLWDPQKEQGRGRAQAWPWAGGGCQPRQTTCRVSFISSGQTQGSWSTHSSHPIYLPLFFRDCKSFRFRQREASNITRPGLVEGKNDNFPFKRISPSCHENLKDHQERLIPLDFTFVLS